MISFTIYGRLPGLNEYTDANRIRNGKYFKGAVMKREAQDLCRWSIIRDCRGKHIDSCFVEITWYEPNSKRDPDNVIFAKKFIFDALVENGVLPNDGQKQILKITDTVKVDKEKPRIEVKLLEPIS